MDMRAMRVDFKVNHLAHLDREKYERGDIPTHEDMEKWLEKFNEEELWKTVSGSYKSLRKYFKLHEEIRFIGLVEVSAVVIAISMSFVYLVVAAFD